MGQINILYCFDSKFWHLAAVSIQSVLSHAAPDTRVRFYAMVAPHTHGRRKIEKIIKQHECGDGLVWHVVKPNENPFQSYEYSRWSPVIWYRLFAHRVFKDVPKMLYLDSDTMICRDLSGLFNADISEYCLGAVRDLAAVNDPYHREGIYVKKFAEKYLKNGPYHNSGVLLLNMKKIAENENLLFETKVPLVYPDQDLLNAAFCGKIKTLPLKYNLAPGILVPTIFPPEEAKEALYGGHVIVHCYSVKPYLKQIAPDAIYKMFSDHAHAIGMKPEKFVEYDKKYTRHKRRKTCVPHVVIQDKDILLFGIRIKL